MLVGKGFGGGGVEALGAHGVACSRMSRERSAGLGVWDVSGRSWHMGMIKASIYRALSVCEALF